MTARVLHVDRLCAAAAVTLAPRRSRRVRTVAEWVLTAIAIGVAGGVVGFGLAATLIE